MKTLSKILFIFQKQNTHKSKINYINKFDYQSVQHYDIGKGNTCKKFDFHLSFFFNITRRKCIKITHLIMDIE